MRIPACLVVGCALVAPAIAQFSVVTPAGYAAAEGNANNAFPWSRGTASTRIQFVVDSTHFTSQGVASPILISQLRYRADAAAATTTWAGGSWPNVRIDMATCPVDFLGVSATFASNVGPDLTTVHNGAVTVAGGAGNGTGIPGPWHITIPLSTPFVYDPTGGADLTVDIYQDGAGWTGASRAADHVNATGSPAPLGSRIYNTSTTALTATSGTVGLNYAAVTEFTYVPAAGLFPAFTASPRSVATGAPVQFTDQSFSSAPGGPLVASASDDGLVAVHDVRLDGVRGGGGSGNGNGVAAKLEGAHFRPHSAIWMPGSEGVFATGGILGGPSPRLALHRAFVSTHIAFASTH
jgi:hypothetical protein